MQLIDELERAAAEEKSIFRAQLLREDLARLRRLEALAHETPDRAALGAAARRLGWTQQDQRTHEIAAELDALVDAILAEQRGEEGAEARVRGAWRVLADARIERLVGCLSTRVPKPEA